MKRIAFRVTGRVQGVGYRRFAHACAAALTIAGHVRNEADGSVTGEAEGPDEAIESLLVAMRQGPRFARVDDVEVRDLPTTGQRGFLVRS